VRASASSARGVNARDSSGSTPLMLACARGHAVVVALLVHAGADLALLDNDGATALRIAKACVEAAGRLGAARATLESVVDLLEAMGAAQ